MARRKTTINLTEREELKIKLVALKEKLTMTGLIRKCTLSYISLSYPDIEDEINRILEINENKK